MLRNGKIQFDGDIIEGFNNVELLRDAGMPRPIIQAVCDTYKTRPWPMMDRYHEILKLLNVG